MRFHIPEMSCDHCRAAIRKTLSGLDAGASVTFDAERREAEISSRRSAAEISAALAAIGYRAQVLDG